MRNEYFKDVMDIAEFNRIPQFGTVTAAFGYLTKEYSEKTAVAEGTVRHTYNDLGARLGGIRGALNSLGLKGGAHVGIIMKSDWNFIATFFAVVTNGMVAVPMSAQIPSQELCGMAKNNGLELVICEKEFLNLIDNEKSVCIDDLNGEYTEMADVSTETPAAIVFTGGTTSKHCKGALLSHKNLCVGAINGMYGCKGVFGATYVALIPFTHIFGIVRSVFTPFLGGSVIYTCTDMRKLVEVIMTAKPDILVLVPALAELLFKLSQGLGTGIFGGKLKTIIAGGAATKPDTIVQFDKLGISVLPGYGLTETSNLVSGNKKPLEKPLSCGHPYDGQELKLVDGELWIKGENIMLGYYNNDEENEKAFEDGWFKTGDLATIDADGDLYIKGRTKNVIVLADGENVIPEEIEQYMYGDKRVKECLVYAGTDANGNEVLTLEIFPEQTSDDAEAIKSGITETVKKYNSDAQPYMRVLQTVFRDKEFAKSASLKIIRSK